MGLNLNQGKFCKFSDNHSRIELSLLCESLRFARIFGGCTIPLT